MCVDGVRVFHENVYMLFLKSRFISGEFCFSLDYYGGALNVSRASKTEGCVLHEETVCGNHTSGASNRVLNSLLLIGGEEN